MLETKPKDGPCDDPFPPRDDRLAWIMRTARSTPRYPSYFKLLKKTNNTWEKFPVINDFYKFNKKQSTTIKIEYRNIMKWKVRLIGYHKYYNSDKACWWRHTFVDEVIPGMGLYDEDLSINQDIWPSQEFWPVDPSDGMGTWSWTHEPENKAGKYQELTINAYKGSDLKSRVNHFRLDFNIGDDN